MFVGRLGTDEPGSGLRAADGGDIFGAVADFERIITCVNAMAPIAEPAAFMEAVRRFVRAIDENWSTAYEDMERVKAMLEGGGDG